LADVGEGLMGELPKVEREVSLMSLFGCSVAEKRDN